MQHARTRRGRDGQRPAAIRIAEGDNVAVALRPIAAGERISVGGQSPSPRARTITPGHKIALTDVAVDEQIVKYGVPIGVASADDRRRRLGAFAQSSHRAVGHARLRVLARQEPATSNQQPAADVHGLPPRQRTRRHAQRDVGAQHGRLREYAAERIAKQAAERYARARSTAFTPSRHPYGCSQLGDDLKNTQAVLAGLMRHPNAGGVLMLGLGCENNQLDAAAAPRRATIDREPHRVLQHAGRDRRAARRARQRSPSSSSACRTTRETECPRLRAGARPQVRRLRRLQRHHAPTRCSAASPTA